MKANKMGVNYDSLLVVGVSIEKKEIVTKVKKYDENTGKPYEKDLTSTIYVIEDTDVEISNDEYAEENIGWYGDNDDNIGYVYGSEGFDYIGTVIAKTNSFESMDSTVELDHIKKEIDSVKKWLSDKYDYNGKVFIYTVLQCG